MYKKTGVILNRIPDKSLIEHIQLQNLPILSVIPSDTHLLIYDIEGRNIMTLPDDSSLVLGVKEALVEMGILS